MAQRRDALAARREARGLTQEMLAHQLGVEHSTVGRWERGTLTPQPWRRPDLAQALGLSLDELNVVLNPARAANGGLVTTRRDVMVDATMLAGSVVADRVLGVRSDQRQEIDQDLLNRPISLAKASTLVADLHQEYQAARYRAAADLVPAVVAAIGRLIDEGPANQRRHTFQLRCSAAVAAAKLATKAGDSTAGWVAAEQARVAAETAEDPFGLAAATYQRACALLRAGRRDDAEHTAVSGISELTGNDPESLTWRGALTLISAVIAARRDDPTEANNRLDHADDLAQRLGTDRNIGWTAFGPTNVRIHRASVAVALDNPHGVLAALQPLDATDLPAGLNGRQAQFHLDNAWAHAQIGQDPHAVIHLLDTERVAPELMQTNPIAHALIRDLLTRERHSTVPGLRGLATRVGVAA